VVPSGGDWNKGVFMISLIVALRQFCKVFEKAPPWYPASLFCFSQSVRNFSRKANCEAVNLEGLAMVLRVQRQVVECT
jgi:hypothetical protein